MGTREEIRSRPDVDADDVDDIIEVAARLQAEEDGRASVSEVEAVAKDLDIDPRHVERAIDTLRREREAKKRADAEAAATGRKRTLVVSITAAALFAGGLLCAGVATATGAGAVDAAAEQAALAEQNLDVVLDRQASLALQLVTLAGGSTTLLAPVAERVRAAPTMEDRLQAADALATAMADAFAALPPAGDAAQQRLNLQYEVVGAQNRVTAERRRWEAARSEWRRAANTTSGKLAVTLGLADAP